jgi:hypothetical protein
MSNKYDTIGARAGKDTYAVKMGVGKWRLYYWSFAHATWIEGTRDIGYCAACEAVRHAQRLDI